MYEKQTAKIIPFRSIDIFENAVSAGTGNFLVDGPKETVRIDESILPEDTTFGVRISGDSMEPEFHDGQIAWVLQQGYQRGCCHFSRHGKSDGFKNSCRLLCREK